MSEITRHAEKIATAFHAAEHSANKTMIDIFALGTAMFEARQSDAFHNLECQRGVELLGAGVAKLTEGLGELARAHREVVDCAVKHNVMEDSGALCPLPAPGTPHGAVITPIKRDKVA
ncbi:MAG: hypothetical protein J0I47_09240 [Sphingomonas sp.]|uniref:hypothetical protein n=1 Tax=Sphingomonas sp. TaxID=28214 RepID=UPI001AC218C7|nr:hypothetical protein [Sphingomonas sp.]MBN8808403.1 hypothetical protein [Sphingomonas sp.]